uniref:Uncharacterized protein n=1 Tax=Romanomermis culicivorax TaxID=13658 RepID=A0A915IRD8_ROMCU
RNWLKTVHQLARGRKPLAADCYADDAAPADQWTMRRPYARPALKSNKDCSPRNGSLDQQHQPRGR